jgi:hypothetical protein
LAGRAGLNIAELYEQAYLNAFHLLITRPVIHFPTTVRMDFPQPMMKYPQEAPRAFCRVAGFQGRTVRWPAGIL